MDLLSRTRDLHTCLYADDLAAVGRLSSIKECITRIKDWSTQNEISINMKKSALLQIRVDGRTRTVAKTIDSISVFKEVKYLGIHVD